MYLDFIEAKSSCNAIFFVSILLSHPIYLGAGWEQPKIDRKACNCLAYVTYYTISLENFSREEKDKAIERKKIFKKYFYRLILRLVA